MIEGLQGLWNGSGIDVAKLARDIAGAERTARTKAPAARRDRADVQAAAAERARAALEAFSAALADMNAGGALRRAALSSNAEVVRVTRLPGAAPMTAASVEVRALAAGQASSVRVADADAPLVTGTVTIVRGSATRVLTVGASDTVFALRDAINASGIGVAARVIRDGAAGVLQLSGPTGAANGFTVTGLGTLTEERAARDAELRIDGVTVVSAVNGGIEALAGARIELRAAAPGAPLTLSLSDETGGMAAALEQTVAAYNELRQLAEALPELRPLRAALARTMARAELGGYGVSTARDGTLIVNRARMTAAVAADPAGIERHMDRFFADVAGVQARFGGDGGEIGKLNRALAATRAVAARDIARAEAAADRTERQLAVRFGEMERAVNASRATQSFLQQQVAAWTARDR